MDLEQFVNTHYDLLLIIYEKYIKYYSTVTFNDFCEFAYTQR